MKFYIVVTDVVSDVTYFGKSVNMCGDNTFYYMTLFIQRRHMIRHFKG